MAHGGPRKGAGRKPGTVSAATKLRKEIAVKAVAGGITPLDVMLGTMREFWRQAVNGTDGMNMEAAKEAADIAKSAAQFVHPRLSSVEASIDGPVSHEDALAELE